jgi:hypothetical protein
MPHKTASLLETINMVLKKTKTSHPIVFAFDEVYQSLTGINGFKNKAVENRNTLPQSLETLRSINDYILLLRLI